MGWQGAIRRLVRTRNPKELVISCRAESVDLYSDMDASFALVEAGILTDRHMCKDCNVKTLKDNFWKRYGGEGVEWVEPQCFLPDRQDFITYGELIPEMGFDVVIHPRNLTKLGTSYRNWPLDNWCELVDVLKRRGLSVAMIGKEGSVHPHVEEAHNLVGLELRSTMTVLRNSKCIVGPSSGPIHLAALCLTPTVVWTDPNHRGMGVLTNRNRLLTHWNPFGVPVSLYEGWNPDVDEVLNRILRMLNIGA